MDCFIVDNIKIREASNNDIPIILGLLYELGRPKPENDADVDVFRKLARNYVNNSDKQILVAVSDDIKIIGMVSVVFLPRLNQILTEMYIPELIVLEEYRNHRIGKKLIESCISLAKNKKCYRIRLESGNQRTESHKFYTRMGFIQSAFSFTKNLS